jgi:hypothetical protein
MGNAAAAQTASIPRIRNCGISTLETAVSSRAVAVRGFETLMASSFSKLVPVTRR